LEQHENDWQGDISIRSARDVPTIIYESRWYISFHAHFLL